MKSKIFCYTICHKKHWEASTNTFIFVAELLAYCVVYYAWPEPVSIDRFEIMYLVNCIIGTVSVCFPFNTQFFCFRVSIYRHVTCRRLYFNMLIGYIISTIEPVRHPWKHKRSAKNIKLFNFITSGYSGDIIVSFMKIITTR